MLIRWMKSCAIYILDIANHLAHRSPSPGGEGRGLSRHSTATADEGELNSKFKTHVYAALVLQ